MFTPNTVTIWLKDSFWPIAIVLGTVALAILILKISAAQRAAALSRQRSAVTEQTFVEHLERYQFDPLITGATYRYLQEVQGIRFPILPSDKLDEDLGLDADDVEQTVRELARSLGRKSHPRFRPELIVTVEGLVRHLQASPRIPRAMDDRDVSRRDEENAA